MYKIINDKSMKPSKTKVIGFLVIFLFITHSGFTRDPQVIVDTDKKLVLEANEITFYGIDFSKLRLINPRKLDQGKLIKHTYCPAWIERFNDYFTEKKIYKMLSVQTLKDRRDPFQFEQSLKNNEKTTVSYNPPMLNIDSLNIIVGDYKLLENDGIGVSIIISEFRKQDEKVTGYITFFDIASRELLYVVKVHGKAGGKGMTTHWFEGYYEVWAHFIDDTYKKEKKKYKKDQKS